MGQKLELNYMLSFVKIREIWIFICVCIKIYIGDNSEGSLFTIYLFISYPKTMWMY